MVVGAFPAAKLGILALKQISKPIANVLKNRAKNSPFFRHYVCMPPAQFYNWMEVKTKMWAMNLGKPMKVPQLNEAMAIELGANLLGEFVIFSIGAGLLIFEYVRQVKKESKKEELAIQEKIDLQNTINELGFRIEKQDAQLRELTRLLYSTENKSWIRRHLTPAIESDILKELETDGKTSDTSSKQSPPSSSTSSAPSSDTPASIGVETRTDQSSLTASSQSPPSLMTSGQSDLRQYSENKTNTMPLVSSTKGSSRTL